MKNLNLISLDFSSSRGWPPFALAVLPKEGKTAVLVGGEPCQAQKLHLSGRSFPFEVSCYVGCPCSHNVPPEDKEGFIKALQQKCTENGILSVILYNTGGHELQGVELVDRRNVDDSVLEPYTVTK